MARHLWWLLLTLIAGQALLHGKLPWDGPGELPSALPLQHSLGLGDSSPESSNFYTTPIDRPSKLPEPLYPEVLQLEAAQQQQLSRVLCPSDRLLLVDIPPGFDGLLLSLQAGLTIARVTERTLVVNSLKPLLLREAGLGDILDVGALRGFWHCFVDIDHLRKEALAHKRSGAARALQRAERDPSYSSWNPQNLSPATLEGGGGGRYNRSTVGDLPGELDLYHMYRNLQRDMALSNCLSWSEQQEGHTLQQYAMWALGPTALTARTLRLPRHLASRMCNTWPFMEEAFWRSVWPAEGVAAEVAAVKRLKLAHSPYAAVHAASGLGVRCHRSVSEQYDPGLLQDAVRATCDLSPTLLQAILPALWAQHAQRARYTLHAQQTQWGGNGEGGRGLGREQGRQPGRGEGELREPGGSGSSSRGSARRVHMRGGGFLQEAGLLGPKVAAARRVRPPEVGSFPWGEGGGAGGAGVVSGREGRGASGSGSSNGSGGAQFLEVEEGGDGGVHPSGSSFKVFMATEPWAEELHRRPQDPLPWRGGVTYRQPVSRGTGATAEGQQSREFVVGLKGGVVYAPAVHLFLMADAEVAVGSMASRDALMAANLRAARQRDTVLAWQEPLPQSTPYWECMRYSYCGAHTGRMQYNATAGGGAAGQSGGQQEGGGALGEERGTSDQSANGTLDADPGASQKGQRGRQRLSCYPAASW